ncbi:hypothetical protein ACIPIX_05210 [Pseudomonas protegens]|uniref:hypothetical protein n=1 Tax=Pseudomonas protegens TaxID=380021 RepID=UPI0038005DE1
MPTENQHLEQRVAALQSDLNERDQRIDSLTFSDNDREPSRRSWFDEAKRLEKEVEALRKTLKFYADREHYHFESGNWDTVSGEPLNILWCGDEPDFIEDGTVARTALSASADPAAQPVPTVPDGYCIMPKRLTAENGAKALLLGEFKLQSTHECPECRELEEPSEGCEICDGEGEYGQSHVIPWDLIKFIYSKAVKGLAVKAEPAKS